MSARGQASWVPVVDGCHVMMFHGEPVGLAQVDWRGRTVVKVRLDGRDYEFRGREAMRHAYWLLAAFSETYEWVSS